MFIIELVIIVVIRISHYLWLYFFEIYSIKFLHHIHHILLPNLFATINFTMFSHTFNKYVIANVSSAVIEEVKRIVLDSEVMKEDDRNWPEPDKVGRQELEI